MRAVDQGTEVDYLGCAGDWPSLLLAALAGAVVWACGKQRGGVGEEGEWCGLVMEEGDLECRGGKGED